jgi:enoyl-[acyl-carrier protein] reductase I
LEPKISTLSTNEPKIIFTVHGTSVYIFASVIAVVGFVMQDVVADTMSTEVIDKSQSKEEIHQELASIQVLARLSLGFAIFITGWIGGELADVFKDEREVVFMIATVSHMPNSAKSAALISNESFTQNISAMAVKALLPDSLDMSAADLAELGIWLTVPWTVKMIFGEAMAKQGCEIALTYQNEKLKKRVDKCAVVCNSSIVMECDVASDKGIEQTFKELKSHWDNFDILVHSVAFAPREALDGNYIDATTRENFATAHDISSYSFTALAKGAKSMLNENGALLTVSYLGAIRTIPNYNVMGVAKASLEASVRYMAAAMGPEKGIRVNAVSAGPIKTLAASGIKDFGRLLDYAANSSALKRNVTIEEVGNAAAFLCSDLASGITGEITYIDSGYNFYDKGPN